MNIRTVLHSRHGIAKQKASQTASSRQRRLVAIFRHFSGFEFFLWR